MKHLFKIMILIVLNFSLSGCDNSIKLPTKHVYILDIHQMRSANINWTDTTLDSPIPIAIYLSGYHNTPSQTIPRADIYVCTIGKRNDTVIAHRDTLLLLDTNTLSDIGSKPLSYYWIVSKKLSPFEKCRINLTAKEFERIKKYRYQYRKVELESEY